MKHILNNLSEVEKNSIREQHKGGMKVMTESFSKLINSKLGDVKPLVNEQPTLSAANTDLSCIDASLFSQTTSDGKKYYVIDKLVINASYFKIRKERVCKRNYSSVCLVV